MTKTWFTDTCPEVPALTVVHQTVNVALGGAIQIETIASSATGKTLRLRLVDEDGETLVMRAAFALRFVDNPNAPDVPTPVPPPTPGWNAALRHSDEATGLLEVEVENTGPYKVWFLVVEVGGAVAVHGDALALGV